MQDRQCININVTQTGGNTTTEKKKKRHSKRHSKEVSNPSSGGTKPSLTRIVRILRKLFSCFF